MPEISVIVPVYNVEKYIKQCLDSILNQTFSDFELICVNDGTLDNSRLILEEYKEKDSRIIIIDKENGGLSSARNAGMKAAKGRFISFVDSDDWIEPDMLENLYQNITSLDTDISICAVHLYDDEKKTVKDDEAYFNLSVFPESFDNRAFSYKDTRDFTMNVPVMAWNKLYRRSLIEECSAVFPEGKIFEDGPFFFSIYFKTKKVSIVRKPLYFYRINREGSIVKKGGEQLFDIVDVINLMFEELKKSDIFEYVKYDFFKQKADDIIYRYDIIPLHFKSRFAKKVKNESVLLDEKYFNFTRINQNEPVTYRALLAVKNKTSLFAFLWYKFTMRFMYKVMQVLYTENNIYYFKFWSLKFRIKKRPKLCDIWYEADRIYIVLFTLLKFSFRFEYSKLEQK